MPRQHVRKSACSVTKCLGVATPAELSGWWRLCRRLCSLQQLMALGRAACGAAGAIMAPCGGTLLQQRLKRRPRFMGLVLGARAPRSTCAGGRLWPWRSIMSLCWDIQRRCSGCSMVIMWQAAGRSAAGCCTGPRHQQQRLAEVAQGGQRGCATRFQAGRERRGPRHQQQRLGRGGTGWAAWLRHQLSEHVGSEVSATSTIGSRV